MLGRLVHLRFPLTVLATAAILACLAAQPAAPITRLDPLPLPQSAQADSDSPAPGASSAIPQSDRASIDDFDR